MADQSRIAADTAQKSVILKATGEVTIKAAEDGDEKKLPTFEFLGYTGEPMMLAGFYHPVIVDLAGATATDPIAALMNHDEERILGQGTAVISANDIRATGTVMSDDDNADKVLKLSKNGFKWQASIGANIVRREFLAEGKTATVNGRQVTGPLLIARESLVHEISFVRRGADSNTSAAVAASLNTGKVTAMNFEGWLQANGWDPASLSDTQKTLLQGSYNEEIGNKKSKTPNRVEDILATAEAESNRQTRIADITAEFMANTPQRDSEFIAKIRALSEVAIDAKWSPDKYDTELLRASRPTHNVFKPRHSDSRVNNKVIEAALCQAGRLSGHEKMYDDQTLQAAHDQFRGRIGLVQFFNLCAAANGYHDHSQSRTITLEAHRAAFGYNGPNRINASGFSTLSISTVLSNVANKFLMEGWNAVDMTPLRLASIRPVSDLKTVTTVSLTGDLQFEKLGPGGEIKHGTLGERTYTNKAETYAKMLAITEDDIINDDLGALTAVPRKLGRGAGLKLNDLFWTVWNALESNGVFSVGNVNVNTGVADMTTGGLAATETIFMNQTDPGGKPLGIMPKIIVVPTALKPAAMTLRNSERLITGSTTTQGDGNIWRDRFRVESSPYISNSSYTGYTSAAWVMMADPNELPLIEIAAYQGRVEPTVESANADFNTLGVQMRGYSRVGVAAQEYRAAVKADGGAS